MTDHQGVSSDEPRAAIDIHCHAIPQALIKAVAANKFASVDVALSTDRAVFQFSGMAQAPPAPPSMTAHAERRQWCNAVAVGLQFVGPWTDLLGYTLAKREAADWTRFYNECLIDECDDEATEILGTIPLSYPDVAVRELKAARDMGCVGVMVGSDIPGGTIASSELDPVWQMAESLEMPVLVHPTFVRVPTDLGDSGLKNAVGRAGATAIALTKMVYSGALLRHPGLSLIASHGGGGFVPLIPRIVRNAELGWAGCDPDSVHESIRRLYVDSVVLDSELIKFLVSSIGVEKILLGSDHPFPWEPDPIGTVERAGLGSGGTRAILSGNAERIFTHSARCCGAS